MIFSEASTAAIQKAVDQQALDTIGTMVRNCLDEGVAPMEIIEKGIIPGLAIVGEKFETGEYFLGELILAGKTAGEAMHLLETELPPSQIGHKGKVILATVRGDIHDVGKNIVGMLLRSYGFEVIDLGVDVPAETILQTIKETGARLVGLSLLLSSMVSSMKEVIESVNRAGLRDTVKIVIGGACTSEQLRKELGADAYAEDAVSAVQLFDQFRQPRADLL